MSDSAIQPSMKVLIVARQVEPSRAAPFVEEQAQSLRQAGVDADVYTVNRGGAGGYLEAARDLRRRVSSGAEYDLVHGHGPAGACSASVRGVPIVSTFHGSDVFNVKTRPLATWISWRSAYTIYVSDHLRQAAWFKGHRHSVIPCGVDYDTFQPQDRTAARRALGWDPDETLVLFPSRFDRDLKNAPLARAGMEAWGKGRLVELDGYSRDQVATVINACNAVLITSHREGGEGGPQVTKEALACNVPVVSVETGGVAERFATVEHSYAVDAESEAIAAALDRAAGHRTNGRERIRHLSLDAIAQRVMRVYESVLGRDS